jgi:prophage regulatory protein
MKTKKKTTRSWNSRPVPLDIKLMKIASVIDQTGHGKSRIYELMNEGSFPRPLKLSTHKVLWRSDQIQKWIKDQISLYG